MCAVPLGTAVASARPPLELADLVRAHGDAYRATHRLTRVQHVALRAIAACRTAVLGGHRETCEHCGATRITYNSCRNRHCPKCQTAAKERWLAARKAELLPVPYFHVVFTLPQALNALAQGNPRVIYMLLFRAAAATLLAFGRDPRYLGGTVGVTAILHTWGQTLFQHLHLHCVVTGGALAPDGSRWIAARRGFLFPVRALARVFRGSFSRRCRRRTPRGPSPTRPAPRPWRTTRRLTPSSPSSGPPRGSSTPSALSPAPNPCSSTSGATRIGSRSATTGWWRSPTGPCSFGGKTMRMATASK
jgi:hypothetical protein